VPLFLSMLQRSLRPGQAGGRSPVKGNGQHQNQAFDAVGMRPLGLGSTEAARLTVRAHRFAAPAHTVVENTAFGGRLGQGDDPWLWIALFVQNPEVGFHAAVVSLGVAQRR